nr:MAG TPA: hypothetical protein [Caudoviricetes sp.]
MFLFLFNFNNIIKKQFCQYNFLFSPGNFYLAITLSPRNFSSRYYLLSPQAHKSNVFYA